MSDSLQPHAPGTGAPYWSPPGFSVHKILQQAYRSGLPLPTAENLPDPGIEPASLASPALESEIFTTAPPRKSKIFYKEIQIYNFKKHCK